MTSEAFDRSLRAFRRRTPIRPFHVKLVSGCSFSIEHPEALATQAGVAVYVAPDGEITLFDHEGVARVFDESSPQQSA
jgi:hypothetical protein